MDFDADTQKYMDALKTRIGNDAKCPMCAHDKFGVIQGYFRHYIQVRTDSAQIGGPGINSIMLVCDHCGYILEFALDILKKENGNY